MPASRGEKINDLRRSSVKLFVWIVVLLGLDQLTKFLIRHFLQPFDSIQVLPFFHLEYVRNRGIAFGMLEGHVATIIFTSSVVVALLIIAAMVVRHDSRWTPPFILLVAGSFGNLFDRVAFGSVTDFLRFPHWPAFNFADIFIVAGVLLLVKALIFEVDRDEDRGGGEARQPEGYDQETGGHGQGAAHCAVPHR